MDPWTETAVNILRNYRFPLLILLGVALGAVVGLVFGERAAVVKPFGSIFINMMFTLVVPLVFFSISSAVAGMDSAKRLGSILGSMLGVFVGTGIVAAIVMLVALRIFGPGGGLDIALEAPQDQDDPGSIGDQIVQAFTVEDFADIISTKHMLALIVFAVLVGLATSRLGERGAPVRGLLNSANEVFMSFTSLIMYYAPIGLGAYFAALIGELGPQIVGGYVHAVLLFYPVAIVYFFAAFTLYAFLAGGPRAIGAFWKNIAEPAAVSLGTSSSVAAIPADLQAARRFGVPADIRETIIPIGATIHMEGSVLRAILKIAFLFAIFDRDLFDPLTMLTAVGIALLSGMAMSGIPGGGFIGELMIVTMYGFPPAALPVISVIGTVIDPPATTVNAVGDNVSSMLVARIVDGRGWRDKGLAEARRANAATGLEAPAGTAGPEAPADAAVPTAPVGTPAPEDPAGATGGATANRKAQQ